MSFSTFNNFENAKKIDNLKKDVISSKGDIEEIYEELQEGHVYSTDEKQVGVWIDGSPIYEKTVYSDTILYTLTANQWVITDISASDISRLVTITAYGANASIMALLGRLSDGVIQLQTFRDSVSVYGLTYTYIKSDALTLSLGSEDFPDVGGED